jgi:hypothetical protein
MGNSFIQPYLIGLVYLHDSGVLDNNLDVAVLYAFNGPDYFTERQVINILRDILFGVLVIFHSYYHCSVLARIPFS